MEIENKMKARTKFIKMYYKMPNEARKLLCWHDWDKNGEP